MRVLRSFFVCGLCLRRPLDRTVLQQPGEQVIGGIAGKVNLLPRQRSTGQMFALEAACTLPK